MQKMNLRTYSKGDAGRMLAHYDRSIGERDHIDKDGVVYNLAPEYEGGIRARFRELCDGLDIDAKSRPLADWVVTKPRGFEGDIEAFFKSAYEFMAGKVGDGRIVSAYVHMDEPKSAPHMHFAFVPTVEAPVMTNDKSRPLKWTKADEKKNSEHKAGEIKKNSRGTVRYERVPLIGEDGKPVMRRTATASKLFTRKDMAEIHQQIEEHLCKALGVGRVGMTLDENDREERARATLSKLDHEDYVRVTAEIERAGAECDRLRSEKAALVDEIAYKDGQLCEVQDALVTKEDELSRLDAKVKGQKERISRLEAVLSSLEKRFDELVVRIAEIADTMRWRHVPGRWRHALEALADNPIARAALDARKDVRVWGEPDARAADRVIKREVKSTRAELGALAEEVKRMRGSSRELEASRGHESRSKGIDR